MVLFLNDMQTHPETRIAFENKALMNHLHILNMPEPNFLCGRLVDFPQWQIKRFQAVTVQEAEPANRKRLVVVLQYAEVD